MKEIEIKILDIDRKEIEEKLASLGAEKVFEGEVNALFFDFEDRSIRRSNRTVRLRRMGDKCFLTVKSPVAHDDVKIKDEYETEVSDIDSARHILESIGMSVWIEMKKHRTTFRTDDASFEIDKHQDKYKHIPEFLEIESGDIETIYRYAEILGFSKEDCRPWTVLDIDKNLRDNNR